MRTKLICSASLALLIFTGCDSRTDQPSVSSAHANRRTLAEARQGFVTKLIRKQTVREPVPEPPLALFHSVTYNSPIGEMAAYVSVPPGDGQKRPAIIWIVGGFANSVSEIAWESSPPDNDQSASVFRKAGITMMYPSLRGGNNNPGYIEGFYGEVDDVLAAADYLAKQEYVDPKRIYLGGHSTGGTLALLVAECSDRFRAVFSFGPVGDITGYGQENLPFNISNRQEVGLRSPERWLHAIRNPTFVLEGTKQGNIGELESMSRASRNPLIHFHPVKGANHFSALAPVSRLIAAKILADNSPTINIIFADKELAESLKR